MNYAVILFYTFIEIENPQDLMEYQRELCESLEIKGRIIIGKEGVNGTLEGSVNAIARYITELKKDVRFTNMPIKASSGDGNAFPKLKIKIV